MAISTADLPIILQGSIGTLEKWLDGRNFSQAGMGARMAKEPSFALASDLVASSNAVIHAFSFAAGKVVPELELSVDTALHMDLAAICASGWIQTADSVQRDLAVGLASRMREIVFNYSTTSGIGRQYLPAALRPRPDVERIRFSEIAVAYVGAAALDQWSNEHAVRDYQLKLERIKTGLGLRISELARVLGVTREAIRQWNAGGGISEDRWGEIDRLSDIVFQLQRYFRPETLPGQVRRKIPAIGGMTALQLIEAGRESELLRRYSRFFEGEIST